MKALSTILLCSFIVFLTSCSSTKSPKTAKAKTFDKRWELLDDHTFKITDYSDDATYGYKEDNPIMVGGVTESEGPTNEQRFLNALAGPNGEKIQYERLGSCCHFKTPNGLIDNTGLLDQYVLKWKGQSEGVVIYINMYDFGELKCPKGLTIKGNNT